MLICPICDSVLRNRFCPLCKKLVKEPWVLDDRIYINRSHSLPDNFCEAKSPLISGKVNPMAQNLVQKAKIPSASMGTKDAFHNAFASPTIKTVNRKK